MGAIIHRQSPGGSDSYVVFEWNSEDMSHRGGTKSDWQPLVSYSPDENTSLESAPLLVMLGSIFRTNLGRANLPSSHALGPICQCA